MTDDSTHEFTRPRAERGQGSQHKRAMELLAPAGDDSALQAALAAGADAVYIGLTILNARRRARNFGQEQLAPAVESIHQHGARAYLTLNIDLAERELDLAARVLELARRSGCDAVLVRDPALLALRVEYPELEFHFSTQTCMTNSADTAAAGAMGATRVVLARELTLAEIAAASTLAEPKTEVFVQGALCFCLSGRCLMSSWVGGRSGNRGACASPCRVPWSIDGEPAGNPLSMHDLAAIDRLDDLARAGVTAIKIEGRMKNAVWVRQAVDVYRRALGGEDPAHLRHEIERLGAYTGRQMTCGYLDGQRDDLTGSAGRVRAAESPESPPGSSKPDSAVDPSSYQLELSVEPKGVRIRCECPGLVDEWTIPKTVVRRPHKAVTIERLFAWLAEQPMHGFRLGSTTTNDSQFLLVPRAANAVGVRISKIVQRSQKKRDTLADVKLPATVRSILKKPTRCPGNQTTLGTPPDRVRLEVDAVESFLDGVRPGGVIVEGLTARRVKAMRSLCGRSPLVVALPSVFFEDEIEELDSLLHACARASVSVEVNSWGGWRLAKDSGARMESGPGLPVLNSLAAHVLAKAGIEAVTLSVEAGRRQLEEVTANCPLPTSMVVFGRPALMVSRVEAPQEYADTTFVDRRDLHVQSRQERGLWVLRPVTPFDLRDVDDDRIRVKHLVVDLVGSPNPLTDWHRIPAQRDPPFHFNYDRGLT